MNCSPSTPMTDSMEVEPSVATEPLSSVVEASAGVEASGVEPAGSLVLASLPPQPASRPRARTMDRPRQVNFFIFIVLLY